MEALNLLYSFFFSHLKGLTRGLRTTVVIPFFEVPRNAKPYVYFAFSFKNAGVILMTNDFVSDGREGEEIYEYRARVPARR